LAETLKTGIVKEKAGLNHLHAGLDDG